MGGIDRVATAWAAGQNHSLNGVIGWKGDRLHPVEPPAEAAIRIAEKSDPVAPGLCWPARSGSNMRALTSMKGIYDRQTYPYRNIGRHVLKERREGFQPTRRCPDAYDKCERTRFFLLPTHL